MQGKKFEIEMTKERDTESDGGTRAPLTLPAITWGEPVGGLTTSRSLAPRLAGLVYGYVGGGYDSLTSAIWESGGMGM